MSVISGKQMCTYFILIDITSLNQFTVTNVGERGFRIYRFFLPEVFSKKVFLKVSKN